MATEQKLSKLQSNFIQGRIKMVEKHFMEICHQVLAYSNKLAHLRDSGDNLSKAIMNYVQQENLNQSMKIAFTRFSAILSGIQDYREAHILRLEAKVIEELSTYGKICKSAKGELKRNLAVRSRELTKRQLLDKFHGKKPANWLQIAQAEKEYRAAVAQSQESTKVLESQMEAFENQKLNDLKKIFLDFINIEMVFHSKALELYTEAYNSISHIDVEDDLQVFRNCLITPCAQSRHDLMRNALAPNSAESSIPPVSSPQRHSYSSESGRPIRGQTRQNRTAPASAILNRNPVSEPNLSSRFRDSCSTVEWSEGP